MTFPISHLDAVSLKWTEFALAGAMETLRNVVRDPDRFGEDEDAAEVRALIDSAREDIGYAVFRLRRLSNEPWSSS